MSSNTDWDIDSYKTDYESDEHWELRRLFMETHKDKFEEDELVCLAQVFTNVEFMGCKYPEKTMKKVALLSQDVAADFRKQRANKLKRTFVGAQDAAGAKAKRGRTMMPGDNTNRYTKPIQFTPQTTSTHLEPTSTTTTVQPPHASTDQNSSRKRKFENDHRRNDHQPIFGGRELRPNKYSNFIIFETSTEGEAATNNALQILQTSAAKQRITINVSYAVVGNNTECSVDVNNQTVAKATSANKKDAKTLAADIALQQMRKECYTLRKKLETKSTKIETTMGTTTNKSDNTNTDQFASNELNENNKGFKMMKLLGWSGGALSSGGIETPIGVQLKVDRKGLGLVNDNNENFNRRFFSEYLQKYNMDADNIHELVFSKDFTKEERATLHTIAAKQGLKSNSKNTPDGERYLIISKKIPLNVLATNVLNGGIYTEMFELTHPTD